LEICKLESSYMFKVALATTVCYDKSCINYKKQKIKTLQLAYREASANAFQTRRIHMQHFLNCPIYKVFVPVMQHLQDHESFKVAAYEHGRTL
jgi:hypothetical protein